MALYPCPECKHEISTDAKTCPHCGKACKVPRSKLEKNILRFMFGALTFMTVALVASGTCSRGKVEAQAPAPQATQKAAPSGPPTVQPGQWFGFRNRELLERATKIATQGDKAAWAQLMSQAAASGAIVQLKPGEEVFLEDTAMLAGLVKIRRKGETSSWWTNYEAVK